MTVLVFGFEPFLDYDENPSDLVAKSLHGRTMAGHQVVGRTLPVEYSLLEGAILSGIGAARPDIVIGFGLAAGRDRVTPEKVALNYVNSKSKDNSGKAVEGAPIARGQPDAYFTSIPVEGLVEELNRNSVPASLSLSAGAYLCNYAMYLILREGKARGFEGGFVHLPCHSEWVARTGKQVPSLPLDTILRGAEVSVSYLAKAWGQADAEAAT